jgi:hypothetical protein
MQNEQLKTRLINQAFRLYEVFCTEGQEAQRLERNRLFYLLHKLDFDRCYEIINKSIGIGGQEKK